MPCAIDANKELEDTSGEVGVDNFWKFNDDAVE